MNVCMHVRGIRGGGLGLKTILSEERKREHCNEQSQSESDNGLVSDANVRYCREKRGSASRCFARSHTDIQGCSTSERYSPSLQELEAELATPKVLLVSSHLSVSSITPLSSTSHLPRRLPQSLLHLISPQFAQKNLLQNSPSERKTVF